MVRDKKFKDEFWDPEYSGTKGFNVLVTKMKDGYKMCKDVEDFFKQRARCDEDYAKSLQKLAKANASFTETGTLRNAWDNIKQELDNIATQHYDAAKQYLDESIRIGQFAEQQRNRRKALKKTYDSKCRESESQDIMVENYKYSGQNSTMKPGDWEKVVTKQSKAQNEARHAETAYNEMLGSLEKARKQWEAEMIKLCEDYERAEEVRIGFLRNELWLVTNICSQTCVEVDNHSELMRKGLEKCDMDADISDFINRNRTGRTPAGTIPFQPYISPNTNQTWSPGQAGHGARPQPPVPMSRARPAMR